MLSPKHCVPRSWSLFHRWMRLFLIVALIRMVAPSAFPATATISGTASQTVKGWGSFPSYFRSDWSLTHQDDMFDKPDIQDAVYQLGITHIRVDLQSRLYVSGTSLSNIALNATAVSDLVNQIQTARNHGVTSYITSCWSPPAVWKDNGSVNGGHLITVDEPYYVNYYVKILQTLVANGVGLPTAISVQNEPDLATAYDSCSYTGTSAIGGGYNEWRQLVEDMRTALNTNGMNSVIIFGPECTNTDDDINLLGAYPNFAMMTVPAFTAALGAYASHTYSENIWLGMRSGMSAYPLDGWITEWSVAANSDYGGTENGWTLGTMEHMASNLVDIPYNYWTWWNTWGGGSAAQGTTLIAGTSTTPICSERYWVMQRLWNTVRPGWIVHHFSSCSNSSYHIINSLQNTWETQINLASFWDPAGASSATMLVESTGTATSMTVSGLVGTAYQVFTSGTNAGMDPGPSGTVQAGAVTLTMPASTVSLLLTSSTVPLAPTGLSAAANTPLVAGAPPRVTLCWQADYGATSYNVKRATKTGGPYTTIATTATALTYDDTTAVSGTTWYYVVTASNPTGESAASSETSILLPYLTSPVADAFVQDGSYATTNSGTAADLFVKLNSVSNSGFTREAFLRFNVAGLANAQSVKVWLVPVSVGATAWNTNPFVYEFVSSDNWIESGTGGITWGGPNAKPIGSGTSFSNGNVNYYAGKVVEVDVTSLARAQASGDGLLSMHIYSTVSAPNGDNFIDFGSRENSNPAYQPYLVYTTATAAPSAPYGLLGWAGNGQVSLSWQPSTSATNYNIKRATTSGGPYTVVGTSAGKSYTDQALTDGAAYYYVVSAVNATGQSANSLQVTALPVTTNLTVSPGDMQASLSWTPSTGAASYNVMRGTTSGGPYTTIATTASPTYTDSPITNGTTYYYVTNAVFSGGAQTANSNEASAQPMPVIPVAPTLSATAGDTQVQLFWTPSYEATSYTLSRGLTSGSYTSFVNITGTAYTDTALTNGTTYYYAVAGNNISGSGSNSAEVSARPLPASIPPVPSGVTAVAGNGQVTLSWMPSYEAASYNILRAAVSGGPYTTIASPTGTTYIDTGLTNQATYYYVFSAVNLDGTSALSSEVFATPTNLPANSTTRTPLADAFIRDGSYANTNSGTASDLLVKYVSTANSGYSRQAFLRFSVAGLANATDVQIWLIPISLGSESGSTTFNYEYVTNDTWIESGSSSITWNNKPAGSGTNFATTTGGYAVGQPVQVDITSFAQAKASSDGMITMHIYSPSADSSGNEFVDFGSRENSPGFQPLLVYVGATPLLDAWRHLYFGGYANSGAAADTANPAGDGIPNLIKYATGTNPLVSATSAPIAVGKSSDGARLTITFNRVADPVLTYAVQASNTISGQWTSIWTSTGATNVAGAVTIQDTALITASATRFLRLVVSH